MDRTLVVEFPWFSIESDLGDPATWGYNLFTDTREIATNVYCQEMKLDLSGYTQSDLTVGFRRSFEQLGGADSIFWLSYNPNTDAILENTIISSVPFNDEQLVAACASSPGFTPYPAPGLLEFGNFNRTHVIHGHFEVKYPNSTIGAGAFGSSGNASLLNAVDNYYSSLEPTAADCLYCYRVFATPAPADNRDGAKRITLPAKRVILDAFTVEEPDLEYMMRLKRSYELANQV